MPNTGQPSRACHACRQQRTKCDYGRPECSRCRKRGRPCPGYRDELDLRFRTVAFASERTPKTSKLHPKAHRSTDGGSERRVENPTSPSEYTKASRSRYKPRLQARPPSTEHWDGHAVPVAVSQFSSHQVSSTYQLAAGGVSVNTDSSALYWACNAVGSAHLAHLGTCGTKDDSARMYGQAIRAINIALRDPQECKSDSILLSVWLLSFYEFLWGPQVDIHSGRVPSAWDTHSRGMVELIRLRGSQQFSAYAGRSLFWLACNTIQYRDMLSGQESDPETLNWIDELWQHSNPSERPIVRTVLFAYHCIRLNSRVQELLAQDDCEKMLGAYDALFRQVAEVEDLTYPYPPRHPITQYTIDHPLKPYTAPDRMSPLRIVVNTYQAFLRMHLSHNMLRLLQSAANASGCSPQQRLVLAQLSNKCDWDLRSLSYKVLSMLSRSFGLGSVTLLGQLKGFRNGKSLPCVARWSDAVRLIPALRLMAACPSLLECQREAASKVLDLLKLELGLCDLMGRLS